MTRSVSIILCAAGLCLFAIPASFAQDSAQGAAGASGEVEESDEAYRRRMELEDARQRNLGYTLPPESYVAQQDKLEQLPEESRDNIRDQLVDIIVENGEWEPGDALRDYPYEPTAAALADADLLEREQAAWDEQIEKYHKREAAAFGTYLGTPPGPGTPEGAGGESEGQPGSGKSEAGPAGPRPGGGTGGRDGEAKEISAGSPGTYTPYPSSRGESEEDVSTAGSRQSALEFLNGARSAGEPQESTPAAGADRDSSVPMAGQIAAASDPEQTAAADPVADPAEDQAPDREAVELDLTTPGIIPIEDLENLEGADDSDRGEGSEPLP